MELLSIIKHLTQVYRSENDHSETNGLWIPDIINEEGNFRAQELNHLFDEGYVEVDHEEDGQAYLILTKKGREVMEYMNRPYINLLSEFAEANEMSRSSAISMSVRNRTNYNKGGQ